MENNLHLISRSGFGFNFDSIKKIETLTTKQLWDIIKQNSNSLLEPITFTNSFVKDNYDKITDRKLTKQEKEDWSKKIRFQGAKDLKEINAKWIDMMVNSENQLGEKMSFFWHHHFAIRHANSFLQQEAVNIIRKHALGNFRNLLREVSKSGVMILSLNNQQNKKSSPNENFAREIMELFAMGIGNYSENDIKEGARAFTGWSISRKGDFEFKSENHDSGIKTIFGQKGYFNGDDFIDLILQQPQTSVFITTKIYSYFVNETIDKQRVEELANSFRKDYDILKLLDSIFSSDWFYEEKNKSNKIKTPVELLVGFKRFCPFIAINDTLQNRLQKVMGQVLFHPPSIAGWPMGKNWIDSSTLMVRLQLTKIITGKVTVNIKEKADDDSNMGKENLDDNSIFQNNQNENKTAIWFEKIDNSKLIGYLISGEISNEVLTFLNNKNPKKIDFVLELMCLPEYQLN